MTKYYKGMLVGSGQLHDLLEEKPSKERDKKIDDLMKELLHGKNGFYTYFPKGLIEDINARIKEKNKELAKTWIPVTQEELDCLKL